MGYEFWRGWAQAYLKAPIQCTLTTITDKNATLEADENFPNEYVTEAHRFIKDFENKVARVAEEYNHAIKFYADRNQPLNALEQGQDVNRGSNLLRDLFGSKKSKDRAYHVRFIKEFADVEDSGSLGRIDRTWEWPTPERRVYFLGDWMAQHIARQRNDSIAFGFP